ncbi:MAG: MiaB/RimO family radical SAM methylthiotransferase, partial [Muribaculaceae bacterium]|nr:MiaB/RimO family radical SAM methylthiotransferase [Muribaculaceae bacterium]
LLEELLRERTPRFAVDDALARREFEHLPSGGLEGRTRAMLKVEDGCVNFCSYCIIPYARGPVRSLPLDRAAEQAKSLAEQGFREIVLTGIELSSWGRDLPGRPPLLVLLEAVSAAAPGLRLRLGSLEPRTVTEEFCAGLVRLPDLCPHFHLSLQSGCEATLRRMNRKYDPARYYESVKLLRDHFDAPGLTTDLIVGFPGETEEEFRASLDFVEKCRFSALHVFPYSPRPGTPAAEMAGQVPQEEKKRRVHRATRLAQDLRAAYLKGLAGRTVPVLFEEEKDGLWHGHAPNYTDVYAAGRDLHNKVVPVALTGPCRDGMTGEIVQ